MLDKIIKDKIKETNISIYRLSKDTGVAYSNVYDIIHSKKKVEQMSFKNIMKILKYLFSRKEIIDIIFENNKEEKE